MSDQGIGGPRDGGPGGPSVARADDSVGSLLTDVVDSLTRLVRGEIALARAEVEDQAQRAAGGIGIVLASMFVAQTAVNLLAWAIVAGLSGRGVEAHWVALVVAFAFTAVAIVLFARGNALLRALKLPPPRSAENLRRDVAAMKESIEK